MSIDSLGARPYNQHMSFRFWAVFCLGLVFPALTQASESVPADTSGRAPVRETASVSAGEKLVTALEIRGNQVVSTAQILSLIKTRVGQPYNQTVISDDIKRLYGKGYFADVRVDREDYKGGFRVIFYVEDKPVVEKISFTRLRYYKPAFLKRRMKTKEGEFLDRKTLNDDLRMIRDLYAKKGLTEAEVDVETRKDAITKKVSLHFVIKEGRRIRIKRIRFEGLTAFSQRRMRRVIKSRAASWINAGYLKREVLDEDMERIRAFYEKEGYIDARAGYRLATLRPGWIDVVVRVEEGRRYFVKDITFSGNTVFTRAGLLAAMTEISEGGVFSRDRLSVDLAHIRTLYFDRGYIFADVRDSTSLDPKTGQVDIRLDIFEGELAYVRRIKIEGNTRTRDIVVRRELKLYPGDRFDGEKLRRSKERLRNLGYFEDISYDIRDTAVSNQKDLIVKVKEAKTGSFSFGGGYSTVDQFVGFVEIQQKNFDITNWPTFTGGGQNLVLRLESGSTRSNNRISFSDPWLFDYPVSGGFDAYMMNRQREQDIGFAFDERRVGGGLHLGKRFTDEVSGRVAYKREKVKIDNFQDEVSADLRAEEGRNTVSQLSFTLSRDARDSPFSPTRGLFLSGTTDVAGGILGGTKDFYRFSAISSYDVPLPAESVLEFRMRAGIIDAYGDSGSVPIFERFFAGGARTIRGYDERQVGPLDGVTEDPIGGESLLVGNVEYTIPLVEFIKVAAFLDSGNVWPKVRDFASGGFKSGAGLGLRVKTPIGPVNLDYGYPLNDEPGKQDRTGKFYFSVSRGF